MYFLYVPKLRCVLNIFFISWTLILLIVMMVVSLHSKVCFSKAPFSFTPQNFTHIQLDYHSYGKFLFETLFGTLKVRSIEVCYHPVSWLRMSSSSAGLPLEGLGLNIEL